MLRQRRLDKEGSEELEVFIGELILPHNDMCGMGRRIVQDKTDYDHK